MMQRLLVRLLSSMPRAIRSSPDEDRLIERIRAQAASLQTTSPAELQSTVTRLRSAESERPNHLASVLVPAFAAVVEAVRRCHGLNLYDVQLRAGLAMARGDIAELPTGEGKTLAAALPAFLHAVSRRGVHVVTPNSYLAGRDFELLAPVYQSLGCSVGLLGEQAPHLSKPAAYQCDVTYGTGYELGFDYLREQLTQMAGRRARLGDRYLALLRGVPETPPLGVRRGFAIVDEIDSVLIDEACTPLILSDDHKSAPASAAIWQHALQVAAAMVADRDYFIERLRSGRVVLTDDGRRRCYQAISGETHEHVTGPWSELVGQAIHALFVLRRDVDYVVRAGQLIFVDESTGRLCPDRRWRNGLQQLLEAKEGLPITPARATAARITRQRYFSLYGRLTGMTGTALESADEFRKTYGLSIAAIAPRLPSRREMLPDRVFMDNDSRLRAVEAEIGRLHATGRPVLVGCRTIERSQQVAQRLDAPRIPYQLLNGKQTAAEAEVIARAGRRGAITIATNMAGRGTDIKLESGVDELGGMHVIAVERNDARRVDRQLAGRVARQGDPGSVQFFVAADDPLIERFGADMQRQFKTLPHVDGEVHADLSRPLHIVQKRAELANWQLRKDLSAADDWLRDELGQLMR
jgi:preprotein translocase subunit SecA